MGRAHDSFEQQQQPIHRNEDLGYGSSSQLARYQSATFSSAAQDRRFLCMSPAAAPADPLPSSRVSSRHKYHAGNGTDILYSRCKCGRTLDVSCPRHNCVVDGPPDVSSNYNIASDVESSVQDPNRGTRPASMSSYNQIAPPDFSPGRIGSESIAGNTSPVSLKHRRAIAEDLHFKEATLLPSNGKPHLLSMSESKAVAPVSSDAELLMSPVRATRDRRQHPGRRASFDGGIWPASNIKLSALTRFQISSQGDKTGTKKEEKGTLKKTNSPIHTNHFQHCVSTSHQCEALDQDKVAISSKFDGTDRPMGCSSPGQGRNPTASSKQASHESNHNVTHAVNPPSKSERIEKVKGRSMNSHEKQRPTLISLGKHLGEHFQNLNTSTIHQVVKPADDDGRKPGKPGKLTRNKNEVETGSATPHRREQGENVKPIDNLNSKLDYKLHSILEVPALKGTIPTVKKTPSSTSLRQAVASLLTPNRHKHQSSKKEDKSSGPLIGLSRSTSHSTWSPFSSTGASAKVIRSFSMDGREAGLPPRGLKGGKRNLPVPERSCRSYDGIDSIDSSGCIMSDTESSSSGGSMPRPKQLSGRSLLTEGDATPSPGSISRRFLRQSSEGNGDGKAASQRRLSLSMPARDATVGGRRLDSCAAADLAILNNRNLQWRFLNASRTVATQSQESMAESSLINACMSLFQLRTSVATKQMALNKARLDRKLATIIHNLSGTLEEWDMVQEEYLSSINKVVTALESAVVNVPLYGVHVSTHSLKNALNSGVSIMNGMDSSITKLLPQAEIVNPLLSELAETVVLEKRYLEELSEIRASISGLEMEERCLQISLIQMETQKSTLSIE